MQFDRSIFCLKELLNGKRLFLFFRIVDDCSNFPVHRAYRFTSVLFGRFCRSSTHRLDDSLRGRTVIDVSGLFTVRRLHNVHSYVRGAYLVSRWSRVTPLILLPYSEHNYYCSVRLHARLLTVINFWFIAELSPSVACNQSTSFAIYLTTLLARAGLFFSRKRS